jgi:hypothetical protein
MKAGVARERAVGSIVAAECGLWSEVVPSGGVQAVAVRGGVSGGML